ncbi:MAG TPA: energy transducer TonB [Acidobacteriaceae bacterium]|nr:energy transducer TonB [Acidobacteriaceae bacterium]
MSPVRVRDRVVPLNNPMMKISFCLGSGLFVFLAAAALAQTPAAATPQPAPGDASTAPLPTDPAALLQLASQVNGLHGDDLKPWHVRATWQTLDDQKQVKDQGSFEEWWAGANKSKVIYKSADVDRTIYRTDHGQYVAARTDKVTWQFPTVERLIAGPVQIAKMLPPIKTELRTVEIQQASVSLHCVVQDEVGNNGQALELIGQDRVARPMEFRYCFSGDLPNIRATTISDGGQVLFNSFIRFQGQYLARKIRSFGGSGIETDISVDLVEPIDGVADADFAPPADAKLVPRPDKVSVASGVMAGNRIAGRNPEYPLGARGSGIAGTVVLQATVLKDGSIGDLTVISGPRALQKASLDAVKTWKYRPFSLNGDPVEVVTQINVVFQIGF